MKKNANYLCVDKVFLVSAGEEDRKNAGMSVRDRNRKERFSTEVQVDREKYVDGNKYRNITGRSG